MAEPQSNSPLAFSPITEGARLLFERAKWLSPMQWLSHRYPLLRSRTALTQQEVHSKKFATRRGRAIEFYIFCWWIVEVIFVVISCLMSWPPWARILFAIPPGLRILEIMQVTVNATLFDALSGRPDELIGSRARMLVLSSLNYLELVTCFGIIYALNITLLKGAEIPPTAFYFSTITQLTIGYGDVSPTNWLQIIVAVQGFMNILFVVLVFGRFMASFPQVDSLFDVRHK